MSPAPYLGAHVAGQSAVALGWGTRLGDLWVAWDYPSDRNRTLAKVAAEFPSSAAIAVIGGDFGRGGPTVWADLPGSPQDSKYEMGWPTLSGVLVQPVPYWPFSLRIPELLQTWRPGAARAVAAAIPVLDTSPLLRLAAIVQSGGPAQRTLVNLAQTWQARATADAEQDLELLQKVIRLGPTVVAATPLKVPEISREDLQRCRVLDDPRFAAITRTSYHPIEPAKD
jgi:hypothetical protein